MNIDFNKFGQAVAKIADSAGVKTVEGRSLLTLEGYLTLIVGLAIFAFSFDGLIRYIATIFVLKAQLAEHTGWDAFVIGLVAIVLSLAFVGIREWLVGRPSPPLQPPPPPPPRVHFE